MLLSNNEGVLFELLNPDINELNEDVLFVLNKWSAAVLSLFVVWVDHGLAFVEDVFEENKFGFVLKADETFVPGRNESEYDPERCLAPKGLWRGGGGGKSPKNSLRALSKIESLLLNDDESALAAVCCSKDELKGESLFCEVEKKRFDPFWLYSLIVTGSWDKGDDL